MNAGLFSFRWSTFFFLILVVLLVLTTLYLAIVNKSGRSVPDLVANSMVVKEFATVPEAGLEQDFTFRKALTARGLGLLLLAGSVYALVTKNVLSGLFAVVDKIEEKDQVVRVSAIELADTKVVSSEAPTRRYSALNLTVHVSDKALVEAGNPAFLDELHAAVTSMPETGNPNQVGITLVYGYDIGIGSKSSTVAKTYTQP